MSSRLASCQERVVEALMLMEKCREGVKLDEGSKIQSSGA